MWISVVAVLVAVFISVGIFILLFQDSKLGRKKHAQPFAKHHQLNMVEHHNLIWLLCSWSSSRSVGDQNKNHDDPLYSPLVLVGKIFLEVMTILLELKSILFHVIEFYWRCSCIFNLISLATIDWEDGFWLSKGFINLSKNFSVVLLDFFCINCV